MLDSFVKTYADRAYSHPTMVRHQGSVIAFAMDDRRRLVYAVLDVTATAASDADRWPASPSALPFPRELAEVGLAIADQVQLPLVRKGATEPVPAGTPVAASEIDDVLSTTARFTADAPFEVVSDDAYVYVFRQSIAAQDEPGLEIYREGVKDAAGNQVPLVDGTLLVDRFVLVGTQLQPTREVRYQRSRSKVRPQSSKDSLGATDLDKQPFVEPTQALSFISGLHSGGFAVVLVPTQVADVSRWQIFVENAEVPLIDAYGIDRSADGLFDLAGTPSSDPMPAGGFAGGALSFAADGDRLQMNAPALGAAFTVEAWLKVAPDAPDGELALLGSDSEQGDPAHSGLAAWISEGTRLRIGFGDGSAFHDTTTGDVLSPGSWNHVAISFDGTYVRVYVDGVLRHRDAALKGLTPAPVGLTRIGAEKDTFRGLLDEVRLWRVVRGASDIADSMGRRLTGLEPGLAVYWRLDDGFGDTAWDGAVAQPRADAGVEGPAWITSDAPIADTTGFSRTGLRVYPRIVTSGLTALLYYQQEQAPSGYDAASKPLKKAARGDARDGHLRRRARAGADRRARLRRRRRRPARPGAHRAVSLDARQERDPRRLARPAARAGRRAAAADRGARADGLRGPGRKPPADHHHDGRQRAVEHLLVRPLGAAERTALVAARLRHAAGPAPGGPGRDRARGDPDHPDVLGAVARPVATGRAPGRARRARDHARRRRRAEDAAGPHRPAGPDARRRGARLCDHARHAAAVRQRTRAGDALLRGLTTASSSPPTTTRSPTARG